MAENVKEVIETYLEKRDAIKSRLKEFSEGREWSEERVFAELCFCICTPQSKATKCWEAVCLLMRTGLLYYGGEEDIKRHLKNVRFTNNKAKYIFKARKFFSKDSNLRIKERIWSFNDVNELRNWLVMNIEGLGMKEASHFLRNIGLGTNLAILDRHVLRNLEKLGVIPSVPKTLGKKIYLGIESEMRMFSNRIGVSMDELDLLLWSKETKEIFK